MALATAACLVAVAVRAQAEGPCRGIEIVAAPDLTEAWANATRDLELQMPEVPTGECVAMTLSVQSAGEGKARLSATARDGRHAERVVDKPAALGSTALGLVASLPPDETAASAIARPIAQAPAPQTSASVAATPAPRSSVSEASRVTPNPAPSGEASSSQVWLSGGIGGRIAEPTGVGMLDLEARADLEVQRWFLSLSLRYGSSIGETLTPHDASYDETVIGLGIGRTIPLGKTALEMALAPAIASVNIDDDDDANGTNGSRSELRFGASVRWSIPIDDWWRFTITADSDFAGRSLTHYVYVDPNLPPLPFWTGGLRFGAAGKLL